MDGAERPVIDGARRPPIAAATIPGIVTGRLAVVTNATTTSVLPRINSFSNHGDRLPQGVPSAD
jgi:hypothetical protein